MSTLWTPAAARIPRATLPQGDMTLRAGFVLRHCAECTDDMFRTYRVGGMANPRLGVYHHRRHGDERGMLLIASLDPTKRWGALLHVSISYKDRNPSWTEIRLVKDAFYGKYRDAMMMLPREADYVNVHEHCFHLWECPEDWRLR